MNKKYYTKLRSAYLLMIFLFISHIFVGWRNAPPSGRTGAPGEGTCANCHGGNNAQGLDGTMTITGLPDVVSPSTTYRVGVEITNPNGMSSYAGMQMVALNSNNQNAGTMANASMSARIKQNSNKTYLEHNPALVYDANRVAAFTMDWTSPAEPDPNVTFYAAGNIADGGGGSANDLIILETKSTEVMGVAMEFPDLTASNVNGFTGTHAPDDVVEFTWDLNNVGTAVATEGYRVVMYLSQDAVFSMDDAEVGEVPTGNTFPGTISSVPGAIRIPLSYPDGDYFMHLVVDQDNTIEESDETNNIFTTSNTIQVETPVLGPLEVSINTEINCDQSATLSVDVSGGAAPYTFLWSTEQTTQDIEVFESGTYDVTIIDMAGGSESASVAVMLGEAIIIDALITQQPGCGALGSADVAVSGGVPPYTYLWSDGTTMDINESLMAGNISVEVTDANSCFATINFVMEQQNNIITNSTIFSPTCAGTEDGSITIIAEGGSGIYTYQWSNMATTSTVQNVGAGIYTVTVSDEGNCSTVQTITVEEPSTIQLTADISDISCDGQTDDGIIVVNVSGGFSPYTYEWSNGATSSINNGLTAGAYTVTVTDNNGCFSTEIYTVSTSSTFNIDAMVRDVTCNSSADGIISLDVTGGSGDYTYLWSNGAMTNTIGDLDADIYAVTVSDGGDCDAEVTYVINEPALINISGNVTNAGCNMAEDGAITVLGAGGTAPYTYDWSTGQNTATISNLAAGTYTVTITDANGCIGINQYTIGEGSTLALLTEVQDVLCFAGSNGSITINDVVGGNPPYAYSWDNGIQSSSLVGLAAGDYTLTLTDASGCTLSEVITVAEPTELTGDGDVSYAVSDQSSIDISVAGGTSPYTYAWSNGATTEDISNLPEGNYTVQVTDANGCILDLDFDIISTSVAVIDELSSLEIYPTPTENFLFIEAVFSQTVPVSVQVISLDGRYQEMINQDLEFRAGAQKNQLDVSHLSKGIYLLVLETEQGIAAKRFIKM